VRRSAASERPAHEDRGRWLRCAPDGGPLHVEEAPGERDLLAGEELAQQRERLRCARASCLGLHAAELELARVDAADADAELQAPRRDVADRRELARDDGRMAEGEQVDAGLRRQRRMGTEQRRRLDEPVGAVAGGERDVVADGHVVEARAGDDGRQLGQAAAVRAQVDVTEHQPHRDRPVLSRIAPHPSTTN
jgi:hypothetical protein